MRIEIFARSNFKNDLYTSTGAKCSMYTIDICITISSVDRADKERAINSANIPDICRVAMRENALGPRVVRVESILFLIARLQRAYARNKNGGTGKKRKKKCGERGGGGRRVGAKRRRHRAKAEARILVATPSRNY